MRNEKDADYAWQILAFGENPNVGSSMNMIGWIFYALLSGILLWAKTKRLFIFIYIVFCILLALNIGGCQRVLEAASQIH